MRSRLAIVLVLVLALGTLVSASAAWAAGGIMFAQEVGEGGDEQGDAGEEGESQQGEQGGEGEGQSDPEAETDPGSGEGATEEEGPPWTYQMSRIGVGLLLLTALGMGLMYWRLVVIRRREGY